MHLRLLSCVLTVAFALPLVPAAAVADPGQLRDGSRPRTLAAAVALFDGEPGPAVTATGDRGEPTFVLRDLARSLDRLDAAEREQAERVLARPDDRSGDETGVHYTVPSDYDCTTNVCVHWVSSTSDAPPAADRDLDGVPDQVETTAAVIEESWAAIVDGAGYRAPRPDTASQNRGPDGRLDVYLADIGAEGYFGFCTSDDPAAESGRVVSAYCVLDDDFATDQFGGSPLESLQVTAAHEFFHAVQFGYDFWEDVWFMEGTAAWVEELVFDAADDNRRYLSSGPMGRPWQSLDHTRDEARYGSWIFWQYLTELYGAGTAPDATVVREVWERATGRTRSLAALREELSDRGDRLTDVFAFFGVVNLVPNTFYEEGDAYTGAPITDSLMLKDAVQTKSVDDVVLDHLTTAYYRFRADETLAGPQRLKVVVDMPNRARGSAAHVLVHRQDRTVDLTPVELDEAGDGGLRVDFGKDDVKAVYVVLTNAGVHDGERSSLRGRVV